MKHNKDIVPMKRRKFRVSNTAKRIQDWKFILKSIARKSHSEKYLRSIGRKV